MLGFVWRSTWWNLWSEDFGLVMMKIGYLSLCFMNASWCYTCDLVGYVMDAYDQRYGSALGADIIQGSFLSREHLWLSYPLALFAEFRLVILMIDFDTTKANNSHPEDCLEFGDGYSPWLLVSCCQHRGCGIGGVPLNSSFRGGHVASLTPAVVGA